MKIGDRVKVVAPGAWHGVKGTIIERYWLDPTTGYDWRVEVECKFYLPKAFPWGKLLSILPFKEAELALDI
jgi:hypothetical protein